MYIKIFYNKFAMNNKYYQLLPKHTFDTGVNAIVTLCDLICSDGTIKEVVVKKFHDKNNFIHEKRIVTKISQTYETNNKTFYHEILYCDNLNNILIYDYFGETLIDYDTKQLSLVGKLKLFRDLIILTMELADLDIIHNDIKTCNIAIDKKSGKAVFIDYGISQFIFDDFYSGIQFDTTLWSGSPEYFLVNKMLKSTGCMLDDYIVEMYKKSQIFPLAGILIGLIMNDINIYFKIIYEFIKFSGENDEEAFTRFKNFDYTSNDKLKMAVNCTLSYVERYIQRHNIDNHVYELIFDMLNLNYMERIDYDEILKKIDDIIFKEKKILIINDLL